MENNYGLLRHILDWIFVPFPEICQIRLDFIMGNFAQPVATTGVCTGQDSVTVTPSGGERVPVLCGDITGQHCKYGTKFNER